MALSNDPVFAQTPKTAGLENTSFQTGMDPGAVTPATLVTAGANGALVTSVIIHAEQTVTAEKHVLWIQPLGTGDWFQVKTAVLAAYTQAVTDAQGSVVMVDKLDPNAAIRLAATDKLGVTNHVNQQSSVMAEYLDY